ncbi:MAG: efflux RND transporter permease subunit [Cytophagales bacterium]
MLDSIIYFSIKNKLIIGLFTLGLVLWGTWSVTKIPIDAVPDITNNQVQIITNTPALAAPEVERLITFPIELAMANIPKTEEIRSFSRFGLSLVTIVFEDGVDVYWARQQVGERLAMAAQSIPIAIGSPYMGPITTGLGEIYQYIIKPQKGYEGKYSTTDLRTIQDWTVRRQLLGTAGLADISSFGGYVKQYEIAIDPERLRSLNVGIDEIFKSLASNNQNTGGAYIDKKPNAYFIRTEGLIASLSDIEQILVRQNDKGLPMLIRDVAEVRFGHATRYGAMTINNDGEAVGGVVLMLKGENSSKVIEEVKKRIADVQKTMPEGLEIVPFLDRTKLVDNAIGTVSKNLIEGALIVIFVLVLMLGNLKAGLVVASVIPLSMLFAISLMNLFGVSGNLMSLGAIDFGLIVDGAVIIVEASLHHLSLNYAKTGHQNLEKKILRSQMDEEIFVSASKIRNSAAFGEIIILIVYLPIWALTGIEGKMFKPMAQTVSFAILGAFILSLTYVPMMSALILDQKPSTFSKFSDRLMALFQSFYAPILSFAIRKQYAFVATAIALLIGAIFMFLRLGGEFIPTLEEGDFAVESRLMPGASLSETVAMALKSAEILKKKFPEVINVVGKVGSSEIPIDPMPVESCDLIITLKDKSEWKSAANREELAQKMKQALGEIAGVTFGFQQPIQMRFNELMTGARQDVVVKIYGDDLDSLTILSEKIGRLADDVDGAEDIYVEKITGLPQIQIKIDRTKIAQFDLTIDEVNQTVRTAFAGHAVGLIFEGQKRFDIVVRLQEESRKSMEDVNRLYITNQKGMQIPISQIANVDLLNAPSQIQRDFTKRRIVVGFNVRERDVETLVNEIKLKIHDKIVFPTGYTIAYGGSFKNLQEAKTRLSFALPIALLLILALLYFTFQSLKYSFLILSAIPLSAIGGVFALWLRDMPFSISAGVGFIALFGVAVLNGIVLISEFNHLKMNSSHSLLKVILQGTKNRLRPVLMTALVASLGFLPMALSHGAGAEVQKPLATVVIGGLITATILTLLLLPILYLMAEKKAVRLHI